MSKIVVFYEDGDFDIVSALGEIAPESVREIVALSDWGECVECLHWNGPRWECELVHSHCI